MAEAPKSKFGGVPIDVTPENVLGSKFGGVPVDQPTPAASPTPAEKPGFFGSFWKTAQGPRDFGNGLIEAARHLFDSDPNTNTLNRMGNQTIDLGRRAAQSFGRGDIKGGIRKTLNTGINALAPGLGASSEDAGEAFDRGDYAEGFGKTLGVGANAVTMALAPRVLPAVARSAAETITPGIKGPLGRLTEVNPRVAVNRALRPTPSDPDFPTNIPATLSAVKEANPGFRPEFNGDEFNFIPAVNRTISRTQAALDPWMARAKGVRISGDQIVESTRNAIPKLMWTKDPAGAAALVDEAQRTWGGKAFSPEDFRDFLKTGNAGLAKFYRQSPAAQQGAVAAGSPPAISDAEIAGIRKSLYGALDPEGRGAGPRLIQGNTGNLIDLRDAAQRRSNAILAEQPLGPLGKVIDPFRGALHGLLPWRTGTGLAYAEGSAGRSLPWLRRAFNAVGDEPNALPKPGTPFYPTGDISRLLTSGDRITPPPGDSSFVRSAPLAPHQAVNAEPRLLPPSRAAFGVNGVVVPDALGRPGQTMHRLIEPPLRPGIPTGQGVREFPPPEASGVKVFNARPNVGRNPMTGRMFRYFTSQPK